MITTHRVGTVASLACLLILIAVLSAVIDGLVLSSYNHFVSPLTGGMLSFLIVVGWQRWLWLAPAALVYPFLFGLPFLPSLTLATVQIVMLGLTARLLVLREKRFGVKQTQRILLMSVLGSLVSASAGILLLRWFTPLPHVWLRWADWWASDLLGILITLPCWYVLANKGGKGAAWRPLPLLLSLVVAAVLAGLIYNGPDGVFTRLTFLFFPLVIFVALRFGHLGVSLVTALIVTLASFAIAGNLTMDSLIEQGFLLTLAIMGLALAASRVDAHEAEEDTRAEQFKLHNVLDALPSYIFLEDLNGNFTYANKAFSELAEISREALLGQPVASVCDPLGLPPAMSLDKASVFQWTFHDADRRRTMLCFQFPLHDEQGQHYGLGFAATDVTDQLAAEEQLRLASQVFENASEGILMTDAQARIIAVNPAFTRITGYEAHEAIGKVSRMFWSDERADSLVREISLNLDRDGQWQGEMLDRRKNGEFYPAWLSISGVRNQAGRITHYVGVFSDFTARKEAESRLQFLAERDPLTQLFNRTAFQARLDGAINLACLHHSQLVLFFIDLDRFKVINDTLGHAVGDELLQVIALRLRHSLKQTDVIARLGGDEFTVLISDPPNDEVIAEIAERIVFELARPCLIRGQELVVTCSIGISRYPVDAADASEFMRMADMAMYRAKEVGKNTFQFYADDLNLRVEEVGRLEGKLRAALTRNQFILHYQPQYDLQGETLVGLEALIRWQHPELGMVPPASFIPLAEESGQIVAIGAWVVHEACRQIAAWRAAGYQVPRVAVNLSAAQISRGNLVETVRGALDEFDLDPSCLELEITESMIMKNPREAVVALSELRKMGARVAIDDFGTGYSSLANLRDYPIDCLKIDRNFVENVPDDSDSNAIIEAIVALARHMDLALVAEGVETEKQASYLRHIGCETGQGYFYGRPQPAEYYLSIWQNHASNDAH